MTDALAPGAIHAIVEQHRAALAAMERASASWMVRAYGTVWRRLDVQVRAMVKRYEAEKAANPNVDTPLPLVRAQELMQQVEAELRRFHGAAYEKVVQSERQAIEAAQRDFGQLIKVADRQGIVGEWNRLPTEAVESMVGFMRDGSPLSALFDRMGRDASAAVRQELLVGLALGQGPRAVARRIKGVLGGDLARALRISRTETMRSYREATFQNYQANSHIINGWRWVAAKGARSCAACLAMDGTWHPLSERQQDHPNGRCAAIPSLNGRDGAEQPAPWETGAQWFAQQPEATQRSVLGDAGYRAYKAGAVTLDDFRGVSHSAAWGDTVQAKSLRGILGETEAARWKAGASDETRTPDDGPHVLGYTWNREPFATVAAARAAGEAEGGWDKHERAFKEEYLPRFKVRDDVERTIGLWASPEPSFNARVRGEERNVLALAKAWGAEHNQDAVALLLPDAQGTGGRLVWDLGRKLSDSELDVLLGAVGAVNRELAAPLAQSLGLGELTVGLTVRKDRLLEYWVADETTLRAGRKLLEDAIKMAGQSLPEVQWRGGYSFRMLWRGADY